MAGENNDKIMITQEEQQREPVIIQDSGSKPATPYSKRQLKRQKKSLYYQERRLKKRKEEKERLKQRRREAKANGLTLNLGPSRKLLKKRLQTSVEDSAFRIAVDLDCDEMMSDRDVAKCVKQCLRIYTVNRRSSKPAQLHFTGVQTNGNIHQRFTRNDGWENWHLKFHFDLNHLEVFEKQQLLYLSSESETVLEELKEDVIYIIGGLVDHNHHKNFSFRRATEQGIRTARLPLGEYVNMKTRAVLSTFHVFEILLRVMEGKTWTDAILQTIPARKGAKAKDD